MLDRLRKMTLKNKSRFSVCMRPMSRLRKLKSAWNNRQRLADAPFLYYGIILYEYLNDQTWQLDGFFVCLVFFSKSNPVPLVHPNTYIQFTVSQTTRTAVFVRRCSISNNKNPNTLIIIQYSNSGVNCQEFCWMNLMTQFVRFCHHIMATTSWSLCYCW